MDKPKQQTILHGCSLERLKDLADNSVDSVVTDPPYGLAFMGKKWDYDVPSVELWREVLRVLKPGGYLLSFGGTRTYHRMVVAIEDAGFEIRDQIQWIYGSGFPKSMDISKAIDKAAGAKREIVGTIPDRWTGKGNSLNFSTDRPQESVDVTAGPATPDAVKWQGFGTALKPANEPIVLARKPLSEKTVASNVLRWGTGALNIDGCRIGLNGEKNPSIARYNKTTKQTGNNGWNHVNRGANFDEKTASSMAKGRWPANVIFDEEAAAALDEQSGQLSQCGGPKKTTHDKGMFGIGTPGQIYREENRGASRFFYCAKASKSERNAGLEGMPLRKRSDANKMMGDAGPMKTGSGNDRTTEFLNNHPTVKPVKLMQYLVRLVTPPGGTVLDPFMGSGSTGVACKKEGFGFVGIERESEYMEIASRRIEFVQMSLFG